MNDRPWPVLRFFLGLCHLIHVLQHCPPYEFATGRFYSQGINFACATFLLQTPLHLSKAE